MAVAVTSKPSAKVTGLSITRSGYTFKSSWKVPASALKETSTNRFGKLKVSWRISEIGVAKDKHPRRDNASASPSATSSSLNINNFAVTTKKTLTRKDYYPFAGKPKLAGIVTAVTGGNSKGWSTGGAVSYTYKFELPRKPTIGWSYNADTGRATVHVYTNAGADRYERYDTMIAVTVLLPDGKTKTIRSWAATTSTDWSATYDISTYGQLSQGKKMVFTAKAYARGVRGVNPAKASAVSSSYTVAIPNPATISTIDVSSKAPTGRITVGIKSAGAYTSTMKLQRRHGEDGSWEDVEGAEDNANALALFDSVGLADPVDGQKIYYRILTMRHNYTTVSNYVWAEKLFTALPTAESLECGIVSLTAGDDGKSAKIVVGWNDAQSIGTEVSWSTDPYAWESTSQPSTFNATWKDAKSQSDKWKSTMTLYIGGLTEGAEYYIRARRYAELEGGTVFSEYAQSSAVTPATQPTNVSISAPAAVSQGQAIDVYWTYDGTAKQTGYQVVSYDNRVLASGKDSLGTCSIKPEMYGDAESVMFKVIVESGGEPAESEYVTVGISQPPTFEVAVPAVLKAQPATFTVYSDQDTVRVLATCTSYGITKSEPDRERDQISGDVVWTDAITPSGWEVVNWSDTELYQRLLDARDAARAELTEAEQELSQFQQGTEEHELAQIQVDNKQLALDNAQAAVNSHVGTTNAATVTMSDDVDFVDTGRYTLTASVVSTESGLASDSSSSSFDVAWEHQAPQPPDVDEDGKGDAITVSADDDARTATLKLVRPADARDTDVYDIYRQTRDGFDLVCSDVPLEATVVDDYPAFGEEMAYRVCSRTVDGDIAFDDFRYSLPQDVLRFDWNGNSLELKYSLDYSDDYSKDFQARHHFGTSKASGYWNDGVDATGSYGAVVIKTIDTDAVAAMRQLASYSGAVFCRTPRGDAFQCNVDVSESDSQHSMLESVSFNITKVGLTDDFMIPKTNVVEPGGEQ